MAKIPLAYINNECSDEDDDEESESDDDDHEPGGQKNVIQSIEDLLWFHGDMSRNTAEALLLSNGLEGSYLLRSSISIPGKYSLSVKWQSSIKHYTLEYDPYTKSYVFGLGQFNTLKELIEHFECQPILGSAGSESGSIIKLQYPYPRDVQEPASYEKVLRHAEVGNTISLDTLSNPDWHIASKEGYLVKRGAIHKNWKKRWFVLQKNSLSYFKRKNSSEPIRTIDLRDATHVFEDFTTDNKKNCFRMCLPSRIFYFYAYSHLEAKQWMKILQWKIDHYTAEKKKSCQHDKQQDQSAFVSFPALKGDPSSTSTAPSSKF